MIERAGADLIEHRSGGVTAGDTLVVAAGDVAIFARGGQLVRVLQAGSYQVPEEFAGPAMAVHFVSTLPIEEEKFGGQLPAGLPVRLAFGTCSWLIANPERAVVAVGSSDVAGLRRQVTSEVHKAVKLHGAKAAMRGAPLDDSLYGPIVADANERLAPYGARVRAIGELTFR